MNQNRMNLYSVLEGLPTALPDTEITGVTDNTKLLKKGMIFVCIKGLHFDGHDAAESMLQNGAVCVIAERDLGLGDRQILVENTRITYGNLLAAWHCHPERDLTMIGITGTNGKTTTATLVKEMLTAAGHKTGLIGTVQYEIGDVVKPSKNTTPLPAEYFELLAEMRDCGCTHVVMEVSSFGLEQHRIGCTHFAAAVFTNLTQDHLDIHGTMENYYLAKKMLFSICDYAVVHLGDDYGKRLFSEISCEKDGYALDLPQADISASDIRLQAAGTQFMLRMHGKEIPVAMRMTGLFNVANASAAIAVGKHLGIPMDTMLGLLAAYPGVRGRCEVIPTPLACTVICDYAHTPDALEKVLGSLRKCTDGRLIAVFGCGGDRDAAKRPLMARAAAAAADLLVVTSDNPRTEDPLAIIDDILTGLAGTDVPYLTEPDRAEAIYCAMKEARAGDVVVLAGKGHEDYQIIGTEYHHMDERELAADAAARILCERNQT